MWSKARNTLSVLAVTSIVGTALAGCGGTATPTTGVTATDTTTTSGTTATDTTTTGGTTATDTTTSGGAATMGTTDTMAPAGATNTTASSGGAATVAPTAAPTATNLTGTTGGATGSGGPFTTGSAISLPANCANTQINYWTPLSGPDGQAMTNLTDQFNTLNTTVKVNITTGSFSDYNTQLGTAAASNTLPDIAIINEDQVATQAFRNIIRPIPANVMSEIGVTATDYPAVAWNDGTIAGQQYAIPLSFVAMTMYVNQDLLTAAGIKSIPTDKASFEAAAKAMTANGNQGFELTVGFPVQQAFQMLLHQYGGTEYNADGTQATWNSDAGVQALTWMKQVTASYGQTNLEGDADIHAFQAGTLGIMWNGIWQLSSVTGSAVSFKGVAAPVPQIGPNPAVWAGGPLLTFTYTKTPDVCKDTVGAMFYKFLIDHSVDWAKGGSIPANNKARASAEFMALPQAAIGPSVANPVFPPAIPGISDAFGPLGTEVGAVMGGTETDIKKALDTAASQANDILAKNKSTYGSAPQQP